jgi:Na+/serine symporter
MPLDLVILVVSIFAFIMSMIGTLRCFFCTRSKWFPLLLLCVLLSGACMSFELHRFLTAPPPPDAPVFNRQPTTPL